jgi:hypothetical protein
MGVFTLVLTPKREIPMNEGPQTNAKNACAGATRL